MSYAKTSYTGDGSTKLFTVPFDYVERDDVAVYVNDAPVTFSWNTTTTVSLATAPAVGAVVLIQRTTDIDKPKVDYQNGSTVSEQDVDTSVSQLLLAIQELRDELDWAKGQLQNITVIAGNLPPVSTADNGKILLVVNGQWVKYSPVTQNAVVDVQVDNLNYKLQKKSADLTVIGVANLSAWTDYHTGGPCTASS